MGTGHCESGLVRLRLWAVKVRSDNRAAVGYVGTIGEASHAASH
jgi:hypothetical protein